MLNNYLLFFFAGLGAFNGLALASYLLLRRPNARADAWLAALVLMISVRTGKSVLFYFQPDISLTVLQIGLSACFLIGPCLIGYLRALDDQGREHSQNDHWYAYALLLAVLVFGMAFPYAIYVELWRAPVYQFIQYSWLACLILAALILYRGYRSHFDIAAVHRMQRFGLPIAAGVALIWLAYFTAGLTSYIYGALSFSLVLYLTFIVWVMRRAYTQEQPSLKAIQPYQERRIASNEAQPELDALNALMTDEQLHCDPLLTLTKLAKRLGISHTRLSQLLNDNNNTSFRQYLNERRIDTAKLLLSSQATPSLELIAEQCGYSSMSTFYTAFKKVMGMTPAVWRQKQLLERSSGSESIIPDTENILQATD